MDNYGFFEGCLKATKQKFDELVNIPRARGTQYDNEKLEIIEQITKSVDYGDLTKEQADCLIRDFNEIQFSKLSSVRKELNRKRARR